MNTKQKAGTPLVNLNRDIHIFIARTGLMYKSGADSWDMVYRVIYKGCDFSDD